MQRLHLWLVIWLLISSLPHLPLPMQRLPVIDDIEREAHEHNQHVRLIQRDNFAVRVWLFFSCCCSMQHPYKLLRNAADLHSSPLCLRPCRTRSSWLQTPGHLYDTPNFERVMVWTVYEMATFGRGLEISSTRSRVPAGRVLLAHAVVTPAGRAWRAHIYSELKRHRCDAKYLCVRRIFLVYFRW